jgi:hypothetical protein
MTYSKLKIATSNLLESRGDVKLTDNDDIIKTLLEDILLKIANRYTVLKLVTKSENFKVLRALGDGLYIRYPKIPTNDTDEIDVDKELAMAVANYLAAEVAKDNHNRNIFNKKAMSIVKGYAFKLYNTESAL